MTKILSSILSAKDSAYTSATNFVNNNLLNTPAKRALASSVLTVAAATATYFAFSNGLALVRTVTQNGLPATLTGVCADGAQCLNKLLTAAHVNSTQILRHLPQTGTCIGATTKRAALGIVEALGARACFKKAVSISRDTLRTHFGRVPGVQWLTKEPAAKASKAA